MKKSVVYPLLLVSLLGLSSVGCNSIEHRSEKIPKQPLPKVVSLIKPEVVWSKATGNGVGKNDVQLQHAFSDELVVTADNAGYLLAINKKSGQTIWQKNYKVAFSAGPTIYRESIFVGTTDGELYNFNLKNGDLLWKASLTGETLAAPVATKNMVFASVLDGSINAISLQDGKQIWRYKTTTPTVVLRKCSSPIVYKQYILNGFPNGRFVALYNLDGLPVWEKEVGAPKGKSDIQRMNDVSANPQVFGDMVYVVSYNGKLIAMHADTGESIWKKEMASYSGMAVNANALYVSDAQGKVIALNRNNGAKIWQQDSLGGRSLSQPTIYKNYLIVGDEDGYLHWLDITNGNFVSQLYIDSKGIDIAPVVQDDLLYVLSRSGRVVVYKL